MTSSHADVRTLDDLTDADALILLDNFEHLLSAADELASLLARAPQLKLLVTSRTRLRVTGEREFVLEPLGEDEAVQFFLERARAARREVRFEPAVTDICRRLDGFPLALELAAASLLTLNAAGERLERGEDLDAIRSSAEDALGELRSIADPYGVASALDLLGHIALRGGDTEAACAYIRESIDLSRPIDDRQSLTSTLVFAAAAAFARGDAVVSTQLWDAYEGLCDVYGFGSELEPWLDDVRAEARKAAAKRAGASTDLDLDAAIDLALSAVAV